MRLQLALGVFVSLGVIAGVCASGSGRGISHQELPRRYAEKGDSCQAQVEQYLAVLFEKEAQVAKLVSLGLNENASLLISEMRQSGNHLKHRLMKDDSIPDGEYKRVSRLIDAKISEMSGLIVNEDQQTHDFYEGNLFSKWALQPYGHKSPPYSPLKDDYPWKRSAHDPPFNCLPHGDRLNSRSYTLETVGPNRQKASFNPEEDSDLLSDFVDLGNPYLARESFCSRTSPTPALAPSLPPSPPVIQGYSNGTTRKSIATPLTEIMQTYASIQSLFENLHYSPTQICGPHHAPFGRLVERYGILLKWIRKTFSPHGEILLNRTPNTEAPSFSSSPY